MSCIAWDGRSLAADRMCIDGDRIGERRKVYRGDGELFAAVGLAKDIDALLAWAKDKGEAPKVESLLIYIRRDKPGHVYVMQDGETKELQAQLIAFGTGRNDALMAMSEGANSMEAVKFAATMDELTGRGLDIVAFDWESTKPIDTPAFVPVESGDEVT